jgi:hypothetical protein
MPNFYIVLSVLMILLNACSHHQNNFKGTKIEPLSNNRDRDMPNAFENMTNDSYLEEMTEHRNQDIDEESIQNNPIGDETDAIEEKRESHFHSPSQQAFVLSMMDFKARWNAISDEQTGEVYIQEFQKLNDSYRTTLKSNLFMEIDTLDNQQIERIKITGTGKTNSEYLKMITSWWQLIIITNPQSELHEIDSIFSEMGIGPNSNFEDLQEEITLSFGGLLYKVLPSQGNITFEAIYPDVLVNTSQPGGT